MGGGDFEDPDAAKRNREEHIVIGSTISHYRIIGKLGEGGMGVVYKAEDTKLKRTVALKFLPPELTKVPEANKRFIQEAQSASALEHTNICNIHEINETEDKQTYIVMACYEGESLKDKIRKGYLKVEEVIGIAIQIAEGLEKAHEKGIVHRDIKPANIFITTDGMVKILDFGLAKLASQTKLTRTGSTMGTIAYMSPEQARGEKVDYRTDIWSLGVVLYEMITGQLPFKGDYEQAVIYSILNQEPVPLTELRTGVPMELSKFMNRVMAKNPGQRYHHIDEVLVDLKAIRKQLETGETKERPIKAKIQKRIPVYLYGSIAVFVVLVILIGLYFYSRPIEGINSIAVLPMENLSGDPEQEYFVDGMTEALITSLSKIGTFKVISRTSSMRYKEKSKTLPEIAKELNVDAVVEGTVLRVGDRIRITAQLIEAVTDQHLWAESYERDLRDILALQSKVARAIAQKIEVKLAPPEQGETVSTPTPTVDPKAYELYLRGRFFMNKYTKDGFTQALSYFQQAIAKEPNFALAYVGLAETYICFEDIGVQRPKEAYPNAREAVNKAIKIDDRLAEAHTCLAQIKFWFEWDWSAAESELKRAIEFNPSYSAAYIVYSQLFRVRKEAAEQLETIRRARELDPLGLYVNIILGTALFDTGAYEQAIEQFKNTLDLDPDYALAHWGLGLVYEAKGLMTEAITAFQKAIDLSPDDVHNYAQLAHALALAGKRNESLQILDELRERSQETYIPSFVIAQIYEGLGDKDAALKWLDKAYEERSSWIPFINSLRYFDSLRGDERFIILLEKVGLKR